MKILKKQVYEVDSEGYLKNIHVSKIDEQLDYIIVDPPNGLFSPKWTGTEWIEGMSQEEIDTIKNGPKPLSEIEKLRIEQAQANAELFEMMLMLTGGMV